MYLTYPVVATATAVLNNNSFSFFTIDKYPPRSQRFPGDSAAHPPVDMSAPASYFLRAPIPALRTPALRALRRPSDLQGSQSARQSSPQAGTRSHQPPLLRSCSPTCSAHINRQDSSHLPFLADHHHTRTRAHTHEQHPHQQRRISPPSPAAQHDHTHMHTRTRTNTPPPLPRRRWRLWRGAVDRWDPLLPFASVLGSLASLGMISRMIDHRVSHQVFASILRSRICTLSRAISVFQSAASQHNLRMC
jgi:hypothetical protein